MKKTNVTNNRLLNFVPKLARKIGENSVDSTCHWWVNQPKVPEGMKKQK